MCKLLAVNCAISHSYSFASLTPGLPCNGRADNAVLDDEVEVCEAQALAHVLAADGPDQIMMNPIQSIDLFASFFLSLAYGTLLRPS